jgi:hypothetical protein
MHKSILQLEAFACESSPNAYRATIKTEHGRTLYLSLKTTGTNCTILDCFYTDRNQGKSGAERFKAAPSKLKTLNFPAEKLLSVIGTELDKQFFGAEFNENSTYELSLDEYLSLKASLSATKRRFLIMEAGGEETCGLPSHLRTRLKNKLHRSVYVELAYYKDGKGVVKQCYYYDRTYKRQDVRITPPTLTSCFFDYTRSGIINLINDEICCNFTHMILIDGTEGIDLSSDFTPICGAV